MDVDDGDDDATMSMRVANENQCGDDIRESQVRETMMHAVMTKARRWKRDESVLEEEVPINLDLGCTPRAPAEAENPLACFFASRLRLASVDVPHPEHNRAAVGVDDNVILLDRGHEAPLLLRVRVGIGNIDVGITRIRTRCGVGGDHRRPSRLGDVYVLHNLVGETRREADLLAGSRTMNVALEV